MPTQSQKPNPHADGEPSLQELLDDSIVRLLMQRDGVQPNDVIDLFAFVRKQLIAERWRRVA